ncbi:MAG TPA: VOC family protein [Lentimicrobium sp.]|nr:VOC family protein [Lentimicrobium sp.]
MLKTLSTIIVLIAFSNAVTSQVTHPVNDTTPRITGIGGVFIVSDNPKETYKWYQQNMGFEVDRYGSVFEFRDANNPEQVNYLSWAVFGRNNSYLSPSKKEFMINYRVQNLEGLIRNMRNNGVTVLDTLETYDYGKFIHIMDPDGNKIELWEPVDSVLSTIPRKTMK